MEPDRAVDSGEAKPSNTQSQTAVGARMERVISSGCPPPRRPYALPAARCRASPSSPPPLAPTSGEGEGYIAPSCNSWAAKTWVLGGSAHPSRLAREEERQSPSKMRMQDDTSHASPTGRVILDGATGGRPGVQGIPAADAGHSTSTGHQAILASSIQNSSDWTRFTRPFPSSASLPGPSSSWTPASKARWASSMSFRSARLLRRAFSTSPASISTDRAASSRPCADTQRWSPTLRSAASMAASLKGAHGKKAPWSRRSHSSSTPGS
mmetsp:Transcript_67624/g.214084  ORF Transcript_67624/g.214084 Transcript_67624/m.214084 type:complete len:267 (+) Transcript_67624:727-1527(+)